MKRKFCCAVIAGKSLSTEEKVFKVEHYFCSYRSGREGGPSLKMVAEQIREEFNNMAPSNTVMLSML
jgi:hypothetical protein